MAPKTHDAIVVAGSSCGMVLKKEIRMFIEQDPELPAFTEKV